MIRKKNEGCTACLQVLAVAVIHTPHTWAGTCRCSICGLVSAMHPKNKWIRIAGKAQYKYSVLTTYYT